MPFTTQQLKRIDARMATALRYLLRSKSDLMRVNGNTRVALHNRGYVKGGAVTDAGRAFLSAFTGVFAMEETVISQNRGRQPAAADYATDPAAPISEAMRYRARLVVEEIIATPELWRFMHADVAYMSSLSAAALGILTFLSVLEDRVAGAMEIGVIMSRFPELGRYGVQEALGELQRAGYAQEVVG